MKGAGPRSAGELLAELFRSRGMKRPLKRAEAVLLWPRVAGPEVARFTYARALQDGVLFVDVSDSETAMHLSMQRGRFVASYHETYGVREVREVRFAAGRVTSIPSVDGKATDASPTTEDLEALEAAAAAAGDDPALHEAAVAAARALAVRRAAERVMGHAECPACGALRPPPAEDRRRRRDMPDWIGELCASCRRAADDPRVISAARSMAVSPGSERPELGPDEQPLARMLGLAYLSAQAEQLLPRAVSEPSLKPHLESVARCHAALSSGKRTEDLTDDDLRGADPRVARVLGWSVS